MKPLLTALALLILVTVPVHAEEGELDELYHEWSFSLTTVYGSAANCLRRMELGKLVHNNDSVFGVDISWFLHEQFLAEMKFRAEFVDQPAQISCRLYKVDTNFPFATGIGETAEEATEEWKQREDLQIKKLRKELLIEHGLIKKPEEQE